MDIENDSQWRSEKVTGRGPGKKNCVEADHTRMIANNDAATVDSVLPWPRVTYDGGDNTWFGSGTGGDQSSEIVSRIDHRNLST